jgi:PAS domain S-box-containing protein
MHQADPGKNRPVSGHGHDSRVLTPEKHNRLMKTHVQGAYVRSCASFLIWLFTLGAYWYGAISNGSFRGATCVLVYIVLMNVPMLLLLSRIRGERLFEYASFGINILEIIGYTGFIYFVGGFRSTYLTPIYAAMIFYVGVQAPMRYPLILAGICSAAFSTAVALEHYGFLPHQNVVLVYEYPWRMVVFILGVRTAVLYVVAFLASYAAKVLQTARIRLKEKNLALELANGKLRQEIDDRIRAETALRESEKKLHDIFENVQDALFSHDLEGNFIEVNRGLKRAFCCGDESRFPERLNIRDIMPERYKPLMDKYLADLLRNGRSEGLMSVLMLDGRERVYEYRNSLIRNEHGVPIGARGSARDITERLLAERERLRLRDQLQRAQKMEAIGLLAGGVAHDLNNILSGLVSYPDLLLMETPEESPMRKPLLTIKRSGEKAASIVQDLLTMARRGVSVPEVMNLNQAVMEYLCSLEHEHLMGCNETIEVRTSLDPSLMNIMGSPVHLFKIIMNLITNAAESMPEGGVITIATSNRCLDTPVEGYESFEPGEYAVLSVTDTGKGMTDKDRQHIFEPFYTKKALGRSGTGLGMAVVWGSVKDHHGYIEVHSEVGQGSTFTLYFPATQEQLCAEGEPFSLDDCRGNGERILVVDDAKEQREIAARILGRLGYHVDTVSSGEEAVEYVKNRGVDLLVLDMIMNPGIDGLETYRRVLQLKPDQKALIASGYSETDRVKEALKIGAVSYIRKPYLLEKIGIAVKEALTRKAA